MFYTCTLWGVAGKCIFASPLLKFFVLFQKALQLGTSFGRYGYGSIFVFASGNGGLVNDNCNFDGYANSIYTLTVGKWCT